MFKPLRYRPVWLALGWTLIAAVLYLSLVPAPESPSMPHLDKLEHGLAYFCLATWFGQLYARIWRVGLALLALGGLIEILQGATGYREASLGDLVANTVGVVLGIWFTGRHPELFTRLESWRTP